MNTFLSYATVKYSNKHLLAKKIVRGFCMTHKKKQPEDRLGKGD